MAEPARLPQEDRPDIKPDIPQLRALEGGGEGSDPKRGHLSSVPKEGGVKSSGGGKNENGGLYNPEDLKEDEENPDSGYFTPSGNRGSFLSRRGKSNKNKKSNFIKRNKALVALLSGITAGVIGLSSFFFMGIFNLPNFVKNIEQAGFQRFQVDMNGRSSKWLQAYMEIRFSEVDDFDHPNQAPGDKDNVYFRANRVDGNKSLTDWYRTLRTSKFEQNVFEKKGIKFTSYAYKENGIIKFRSGVIKFPDGEVKFDPAKLGYADLDALEKGDVSKFNGQLSDSFDFEKFDNDKDARAAIKAMVNENDPGWWKAMKRYHVRQDIQSMIGVRKWTFFENKRNALHEKKVSYRNKIITQALPDESKTGDFIKCLFGVPECKASSDPGNQNADDHGPTGKNKSDGDPNHPDQAQKTDGDPKNPQPVGDGSAEEALKGAGAAGDLVGKIASKLIAKAGILSMLDSLARFDKALHDHTLSKIITQQKTLQAMGYFTVFEVASDQLTTGQQNSSEVNDFMQQFKHPTNNEGWTTVIEPDNNSGKASAASTDYVKAKNKAQFCSDTHQAEMKAHPREAENEYQYSCAKDKIGATSNAGALEEEWNSGIGVALHPVLDAFHKVTGGLFDVFNSVTGAVTGTIINGGLAATGTQDDVKNLAAAAGAKAMEIGGANNMGVTEDSPSGQLAMVALQGSSATGEASMRDQGGALTTPASRTLANRNVLAYEAEQQHTGFFNRYLSPSNPKSLFATQFFRASTNFGSIGQNLLTIFGNAISNPLKALTQPAHAAAPNGYSAANFSGIETFDMPSQCLDNPPLNMTPQNSTNADDLGYFKPSELTWDLMNNKKDWYAALYDKVDGDEDKAKAVWNCALFDNSVRGSMSARYGYTGENSLESSGQQGSSAGSTTVISGDAQELAREILNNKNISIGASDYCRYCEEDIRNTSEGKPAYGNVQINLNILKFLAELGSITPININSITGEGSGHSDGSNHYSGNAVDFECGFDEAKADEIAKKYGLMAGNERCDSGTDHSHFSKDGY